eukprot:6473176-Prymnesium_polylepis.1
MTPPKIRGAQALQCPSKSITSQQRTTPCSFGPRAGRCAQTSKSQRWKRLSSIRRHGAMPGASD